MDLNDLISNLKSLLIDFSDNKNENLNTFVSIFPFQRPRYALLVMLENPQVAKNLIYDYRGMKIKGTRNEAGWNSVYVTGKIIKKIGPILAIKNKDFNRNNINNIISAKISNLPVLQNDLIMLLNLMTVFLIELKMIKKEVFGIYSNLNEKKGNNY